MKNIFKNFIKKCACRALGSQLSDIYKNLPVESVSHDIEGYFETSDGRPIPVTKHHRYTLKKTWTMFGPLSALSELNEKNLLSKKDQKFFNFAKGYRTIEASLSEVREVLKPYLEKYEQLFLSTKIPDLAPRVLKPTKDNVEKAIQSKIKNHNQLFQKIENYIPSFQTQNAKILEVGYTSGGESIIGFERLGMDAYGIDYNYDGNFDTNSRHQHIANLADSKATFLTGDITKKTSIESEFLDMVYTLSVLEHIQNLPAAFNEMYRILKPGGVMYHRYDPYFHIKGGHPPCMFDSPWAHMRMDDQDIKRYIQEFRPYEAESTIPWIESALNRKHTQSFVQNALSKSGFNIYWWQNLEVSPTHHGLLKPDILLDCLEVNQNVSLTDLLSYAVAFIAVKPE